MAEKEMVASFYPNCIMAAMLLSESPYSCRTSPPPEKVAAAGHDAGHRIDVRHARRLRLRQQHRWRGRYRCDLARTGGAVVAEAINVDGVVRVRGDLEVD